ncbi:MAG TPA: hypothetical protein VFM94_12210 [Solirubrobacterales bacterium]|nr:hypothetical protein [Solirubrobacterales bacterium]
MALSDDQRALLRLLARREEGYEDIAALKGLSVEDLRVEVNDALAELEASSEAPPAPPADEPAAKPQVEEGASDILYGEERVHAGDTRTQRASKRSASPGPAAPRKASSRPTLPPERRRLVLLTGGALGIVAIVLAAIALIGGGDGGSDSTTSAAGSDTELTASENGRVTQAVLAAADGSDASGRAIFGRVGKEEIVLQVTAENLQPTEQGESYTVWLYRTPKLSLRVGSVAVGEEGNLGARFTIPAELLAYVASGAFDRIYVSRTSNAAYQQEVARAKKSKSLPRYIGETVLTGQITGPIAKTGG